MSPTHPHPVDAAVDDLVARRTASTPAGCPVTRRRPAAAVAWLVSEQAGYLHRVEVAVGGGITATGWL